MQSKLTSQSPLQNSNLPVQSILLHLCVFTIHLTIVQTGCNVPFFLHLNDQLQPKKCEQKAARKMNHLKEYCIGPFLCLCKSAIIKDTSLIVCSHLSVWLIVCDTTAFLLSFDLTSAKIGHD